MHRAVETRFPRHRSISSLLVILTLAAVIFGALPAQARWLDLGPVRDYAQQWLCGTRGMTPDAAKAYMRHMEEQKGNRIIERQWVPNNVVFDVLKLDGTAPPGRPMLTYEKSVHVFTPESAFGRVFCRAMEGQELPGAFPRIRGDYEAARRRGYFSIRLTPQQRDRLLHPEKYPGRKRVAAATPYRVTIIATKFPAWTDQPPATGAYYRPMATPVMMRHHPISGVPPDNTARPWLGEQPGGRIVDGNQAGVQNPWGTEHPAVGPQTYTDPLAFQLHWENLLFNKANPNSVTNWFFENSHGLISYEGNRSDIWAWPESRHVLDRQTQDQAPIYLQWPGTPIIRTNATWWSSHNASSSPKAWGTSPNKWTFSWTDSRITIMRQSDAMPSTLSGAGLSVNDDGGTDDNDDGDIQYWDATASAWRDVTFDSDDYVRDAYDARRATITTGHSSDNNTLRLRNFTLGAGPFDQTGGLTYSFDGTLPDNSTEIIDPQGYGPGVYAPKSARLKSFCYYTHDHMFSTSASAYQLEHRREGSTIDDIGGGTESTSDRKDRDKEPYDHDVHDHSFPTMGYFHYPNNNNAGNHSDGGWHADANRIMADYGITTNGAVWYIYPGGAADESGGTSGPWSGAHVFIPNSGGTLPENAALGLVAHEWSHTHGAVDVYDLDFYWNAGRKWPPHKQSIAMDSHSVMGMGSCLRMDPFNKPVQQDHHGLDHAQNHHHGPSDGGLAPDRRGIRGSVNLLDSGPGYRRLRVLPVGKPQRQPLWQCPARVVHLPR